MNQKYLGNVIKYLSCKKEREWCKDLDKLQKNGGFSSESERTEIFNNEELLNSQHLGSLGFVSLIPLVLFLSQENVD